MSKQLPQVNKILKAPPMALIDPNFATMAYPSVALSTVEHLNIYLSSTYDEQKLTGLGTLLQQNLNIHSLTIEKEKEEQITTTFISKLNKMLLNSGISEKNTGKNTSKLDFFMKTPNYSLTVTKENGMLKAHIEYKTKVTVEMNALENAQAEILELEKNLKNQHLQLVALEAKKVKPVIKKVRLRKSHRTLFSIPFLKKRQQPNISTILNIKSKGTRNNFQHFVRKDFDTAFKTNNFKQLRNILKINSKFIYTQLATQGKLPLDIAVSNQDTVMVEFLLTYNIKVNFSHLVNAFELNNIDLFDLIYIKLLNDKAIKGIDHPIPNTAHATFLQLATAKNLSEFVCYLLNLEADPNLADLEGKTPFFFALENGNIDIMKLLLLAKNIRQESKNNNLNHATSMQNNSNALRNILSKALPAVSHRKVLRLFLSAQTENFLKSNVFMNQKNNDKQAPLDLVTTEDGHPLKIKADLAIPILNAINLWSDRDLATKKRTECYMESPDFIKHANISKNLVDLITSFITVENEYSSRSRTAGFWSTVSEYRSPFEPETITTLFELHNTSKEKQGPESLKTQHDTVRRPSQILAAFTSLVIREINSLRTPVTQENIYHVIEKSLRNLFSILYKDDNLSLTDEISKLVDLAKQFNNELPFHVGKLPSDFTIPTELELLEKIVCPALINSYRDQDLIKVARALELKHKVKLPLLADLGADASTEETILKIDEKQILRQYILTYGNYITKVQKIANAAQVKKLSEFSLT